MLNGDEAYFRNTGGKMQVDFSGILKLFHIQIPHKGTIGPITNSRFLHQFLGAHGGRSGRGEKKKVFVEKGMNHNEQFFGKH